MADHVSTLPFHCPSQCHSSSSPPQGLQNGNGNGYHQFEDTLPLDDTMVLDSPLAETQLEKLEFDTEAVDDFDCHEEVVLDSEDESICKNKGEKLPYEVSDHHALNLLRRAAAPAYVDEQIDLANKGCQVNFERTDEQKDPPLSLTCNNGFAEPEESSQADALEFVDQFLSSNKVETSAGLCIKKFVREKSPPVPRAKGPHSLAKRMNFRVTPLAKPGNFEWSDSDQHRKDDVFSKRIGAPFGFGGFRLRSAISDQKVHGKGGSISDDVLEEKKELQKEKVGSTHSDSRFADDSLKEAGRIEQESKLNLENNTAKEFNDNRPMEASEQQLEAPELFDVGFNTQVAAEAMEALSYAPCAGCVTFDAYQGPLNTTEDSLKATTIREYHLEHTSLAKSDFYEVGGIGRKSKRRKRSAGKSRKKSNTWGLDPELVIMKKVKRIGEQFNCKNSANSNENSGRRSPKPIMQRQLDGTAGGNIEKCKNYLNSSLSVEHVSLRTEQAEEKLESSSRRANEPRQSLAGDTLSRTSDQSDNPGEGKNDDIIYYRRKRSRSIVNPTKVANAIGRCSELFSDTTSEARNRKFSQKELTGKELTAITSCLKIDIWSHPKGKRTFRKVQRSLKSNNLYSPSATINETVGKSYYIRSQKSTEDNDKTSCDNKDKQGKIQSELQSSSCYSSKDLRKNFKPGSAVFTSISEPASEFKGTLPAEPEKTLSANQSSKVKDLDSLIFSNDAEKTCKCGVSSERNLEPVGPGYYKRPFNKNLPKSSLLKELLKLGVPESIRDFTWKDLRRRRDIAYIRVLFSQHLDDNLIKQQKKISARLGISIAPCPMDATHFVADRFVRTRNMLEAVALGKPVVTPLWLESCRQASCLIDEKNYILRDAKKEKEIGFSMPVTLARASQQPLLKGLRVFITQNIKPPKEMLTSLVKAVQGQVVESSQILAPGDPKTQDDLLILSCEEDHEFCVPFLGVAAYSSELLLNGLIIQKLEFERHRLFKNYGERN